MSKEYEKALNVISKPPEKRYDHEIHHLVPWFRSKAKLFKSLKADILADIIRNCNYVTKTRDDVIIKQGDVGECFYIVLSGKVTIYILNKDQVEGEEDDGNFDNIIQYTKDGTLDRIKLGYCVTSLESGAPFGDVALTSGDSIRTASIIADEHTDLLVVDRALYNRSVKEVLAKEFLEKTTFIQNNPLFSVWPAKYRKQLAMALYNESFAYESALVRQGDITADMYFILSGQVEIQMDPSHHPQQYPHIFKAAKENEADKLIKKADTHYQRSPIGNTNNIQHNYINNTIKRRGSVRCTRLCHLGVNECVGDVELTMDLPTYMQTAVCKEVTVVLVLESKHYERLFIRRHPRTIESMRDQIGVKLTSRMSMLNTKHEIPFLNFLKKIIDSRHRPLTLTDKDKEEPTVFEAEKEFLNHKGPLIDQDGPGSVFYLIRIREKTKMRVRAKRGERIDRHLPIPSLSLPKTFLMPVATQVNSMFQSSFIRGNPSSRIDQTQSPKNTDQSRQDATHQSRQDATHQSRQDATHLGENRECQDSAGDQNSDGGHSPMSSLNLEFENVEKHDTKIQTLEDRLRQWLELDNPKGKPQVAQLRRLAVQDMEIQPKPGNKVVVRRKNRVPPEDAGSSSSFSSSDKETERSKVTEESRLAAYSILLTH